NLRKYPIWLAEKEKAHRVFYKILEDIINGESLEKVVHSFAQNLIKNSK
ncbi:2284_t:CDS:2, partial [Rhizophagus irregularis]